MGILDLGGASTQIAFVPESKYEFLIFCSIYLLSLISKLKGDNRNYDSFYQSVDVFDTVYDVFSHSFSCRGQSQAILMYQT